MFDEANDTNYNEVVLYIRNFLQRSDVIELLESNRPSNQIRKKEEEVSEENRTINVNNKLISMKQKAFLYDDDEGDDVISSSVNNVYTKTTEMVLENTNNNYGLRNSDISMIADEKEDGTNHLSNMLKEMDQEFDSLISSFTPPLSPVHHNKLNDLSTIETTKTDDLNGMVDNRINDDMVEMVGDDEAEVVCDFRYDEVTLDELVNQSSSTSSEEILGFEDIDIFSD